MNNTTTKGFISHLCSFLPDRREGKRGTKPIPKKKLIKEYMRLIKQGLQWRDIKHSTTVRRYITECQRRGLFKKYLENIVADELAYRAKEAIVDACEFDSWDVSKEVAWSGKQKGFTDKVTLEITPEYIPIFFRFAHGCPHDISEWKKIIKEQEKLPYKVYLDKGYESYELRRDLRKENCQVKIEPKNFKTNHKRGPQFQWSEEDHNKRCMIERFFAWMQSFKKVHERKERTDALFHAFTITSIAYYALKRKNL